MLRRIALFAAWTLLACARSGGAPARLAGGEALELSDGRIVHVIYSTDIATGESGRTVTGMSEHTWFEDAAGNLVVVEASSEPDGLTIVRFSSATSKDRIEVRVDYGFAKSDLRCPVQVTVNGTKYRALLAADGSTPDAEEALRKKLAPELGKLSAKFRAGLASLFSVGNAGYPQMGRGWAQLAIPFEKSELSTGIAIAATQPMSEVETQRLQARFAVQ